MLYPLNLDHKPSEFLFPPLNVFPYHREISQISLASEDGSPNTPIFIHFQMKLMGVSLLCQSLIWKCILVCTKSTPEDASLYTPFIQKLDGGLEMHLRMLLFHMLAPDFPSSSFFIF